MLRHRNFLIWSAFWLFGLINNVLYVIILAAALDMVGPSIPTAAVLLCDVVPSLLVKLTLPHLIQPVPYAVRVVVFVVLSAIGMLIVGATPARQDISMKMCGVVLASLSSGAGELSFLALTTFYGKASLAGWGSGTGAAGLVGAGMYTAMTTTFAYTSQSTLHVSAFLPAIMFLAYFFLLPSKTRSSPPSNPDSERLLPTGSLAGNVHQQSWRPTSSTVSRAFDRLRPLLKPYIIPLFLVYLFEYLINQSLLPNLIFSRPESIHPSSDFHVRNTETMTRNKYYPLFNTIYQLGVFISRSSLPLYTLRNLYAATWLQMLNLLIVLAWLVIIPPLGSSVGGWFPIMCILVLWEGILGGAVYMGTFASIRETTRRFQSQRCTPLDNSSSLDPSAEIDESSPVTVTDATNEHLSSCLPSTVSAAQQGDSAEEEEFAMAAVTASDSLGICVAGLVGLALNLQQGLCQWQIRHGRDWCAL